MTDNASHCGTLTRQYEAAMMSAESHAANVTLAAALIARRPDADEPADYPEFGTRADMLADMLGLGEVLAPVDTVHGRVVQHLITGHTMTRRSVLR